MCPNFLVGSFQTRGPELQARFDPVISVGRFRILSLEGIRSVIHLVLALKNSGSLLRSCHRELFPRPAQCRTGASRKHSVPSCVHSRSVFCSSEAMIGLVQPLPGSQRGRITLNSVPQSRCAEISRRAHSNRKGPAALRRPVPFRLFFSSFFFFNFFMAPCQSPGAAAAAILISSERGRAG